VHAIRKKKISDLAIRRMEMLGDVTGLAQATLPMSMGNIKVGNMPMSRLWKIQKSATVLSFAW